MHSTWLTRKFPGTSPARAIAFGISLAFAGGAVQAQGAQAQGASAGASATGPAAEVQRSYAAVKANILKAVNNMPADAYSYKPTPDIRTFARVVNHVSEAQAHSCGAASGAAAGATTAAGAPISVPSEAAGKAAIVAALQTSFAACDAAFAALTDTNLSDMLAAGPTRRSRIGLLWGTVSHDNEQYATLALYMRLKGFTPPSSEK